MPASTDEAPPPKQISEAGRRMLLSSMDSRPIEGLIDFRGAGTGVGLARASWNRAAGKLVEAGLIRPYVHGGFEITDEGRALRDEILAEDSAGMKP